MVSCVDGVVGEEAWLIGWMGGGGGGRRMGVGGE